MILRERLASLGYQPRPLPRAEVDLNAVAGALGAEVRENGLGPYLCIEDMVRLEPPGRSHGAIDAGAHPMAALDLLGTSRPDAGRPRNRESVEGFCFLDTETTGLSAGVGNFAFLVGLAWRRNDGLLLRQYLLADPGQEPAFLQAICADLEGSQGLVTYNGRSFDAHVLEGRLVLARRSATPLQLPHLDLLHPVRRIFRERLGSCSLASVEALVLGQEREDDIPGYMIPQAYFEFLRLRETASLRRVLAHNRQDVVSLSVLFEHLACLLASPGPAHPLDRFGMARLLEGRGAIDRALEIYCALWAEADGGWDGEPWPEDGSPLELAYTVGLRLAIWLRRRHEPGAEAILRRLWQVYPRPWAAAVLPAKELEHRRKNPAGALELVDAAMLALEALPERDRVEARSVRDLRHRQERLNRQHLRAGAGGISHPAVA